MVRTQPRGFVALLSALIISVVLLLIASGGSLSGFYTRSNALLIEDKERSEALADACVHQTLLALAIDDSYDGNATTTIGGEACYTGPITENGSDYTFKARAYVNHAYTTVEVEADTVDLSVTSYRERPTY